MNILQSLTSNKHILRTALGSITGSMEKDGVSAIVIIRDPNNNSEENPGLDIKAYKERIGILTGEDLEEYEKYIRERDNKNFYRDLENFEKGGDDVHND